MIRTALAIVLIAASASVAHANVPAQAQVTVMPRTTVIADSTAQHSISQDRQMHQISRGHADLDRRLQVPTQVDTIATA
ncbi:hypothetical protein [Devosia sp. FKR38]|uniref:hypothetical protein n=1 Tax=Devosia sp. FKR38 TaxID=2562312 RepID=UPI0010BFF1BF|nr:hypothetical protein [Devosia sp. FKR38]